MESIIKCMETLLAIHEELLLIGRQKVELVKKGDMTTLETLVREETKLIQKLQITERVRTEHVQKLLKNKGEIKENATLTDVKKFATAGEKDQLEQLQDKLFIAVQEVKKQNAFNQQLIEESLRFVNLSLDLIVPHSEDISYKKPGDQDDDRYETGHSLFDSKA